MMRHTLPFMLLGLALLLAACGTTLDVVGTYDEVWDATSGAVRDEATRLSGRSIPTPPGRQTGQARTSVVDTRSGREVFFFAEIKPVGAEEVRKHEISLFIHEESSGAGEEQVRSTRRQDLEKRVASSIREGMRESPEP